MNSGPRPEKDGRAGGRRLHRTGVAPLSEQAAAQKSNGSEPVPKADLARLIGYESLDFGFGFLFEVQ